MRSVRAFRALLDHRRQAPVVEEAAHGPIETRQASAAVIPTVDSMTGFIFFSSAT